MKHIVIVLLTFATISPLVAADSPAAEERATPSKISSPAECWRAVIAAMKADDLKTLTKLTTADGLKNIQTWSIDLKKSIKELSAFYEKQEVHWDKLGDNQKARASLGEIRPAMTGIQFAQEEDGWKFEAFIAGD